MAKGESSQVSGYFMDNCEHLASLFAITLQTLLYFFITLPTMVHLVKAMIFPVVVYGCERWTIEKAEYQKIDAFELWCWRRLEGLLDCKEIQPVNPKGNQS